MSRQRLEHLDLAAFAAAHPGWRADEAALGKSFRFGSYADGVAFAMALALASERADHHPELTIGWCTVRVRWTTHDAGGTTTLDRKMALETDALAARHGGRADEA